MHQTGTATLAKPPSAATLATYAEAHNVYLASLDVGTPLTGLELGERFGKGQRWGRLRIEEAKALAAAPLDAFQVDAPAVQVDASEADGMPRHAVVTRTERFTALLSVTLVAVAAAVASFAHQHHVAHFAGEGWRAFLFPLSVDGLVIAASTVANIRRRSGSKVGALAACSLALGIVMTVAANVVAAEPTVVPLPVLKAIVGAWSPVAFGLASELVREVVHRTRR